MKSSLLLNIGLARKGKDNLTIRQVYHALAAQDISVMQSAVHKSNTELTFVCKVVLPVAVDDRHPFAAGDLSAVHRAAERLEQDCIAVWDDSSNAGVLVGPRAAAWGTFNPSFFLKLDGKALA